jgi:hypothetical protein
MKLFVVAKYAGKSLGLPADFPENFKSAWNGSLMQNSQKNP